MRSGNDDFDARFERAQADAAGAAEKGFDALSRQLHALIQLQTEEIGRLRGIIADGTTIPERHATHANLTTYTRDGRERRDVLACGTDRNLWLLADAPTHPDAVKYHAGWVRLPPLPQAADEMERGNK